MNKRENYTPTETKIGMAFARLVHFCYIFYLVVSIIGVISYIVHLNMVLYTAAALVLIIFIVQLLTGYSRFKSGIIFLPIGAVLGYLLINQTIEDACLGILIVFIIRHVIRDIFYKFVRWLIRIGNE